VTAPGTGGPAEDAQMRPKVFGCWIVYCLHCDWMSQTCRDKDTLVAVHREHTEHILGLVGAARELTAGEMAEHLPEGKRAVYWDRSIGRYFDEALGGSDA
jgi:hypothetical protein